MKLKDQKVGFQKFNRMKVFGWQEVILNQNIDFFKKGSSLTIGCFDGPHLGHKILFDKVKQVSDKNNYLSGILTFSNPEIFIKKHKNSGTISTVEQRMNYFKNYNFDFIILVDFNQKFSRINGVDFFKILVDCLNLKFLAEGNDFKCGNKGLCNSAEIKKIAQKLNFNCEFEDLVISENTEYKISSSLIRQKIKNGEFSVVKKMLGFDFELSLQNCKIEVFENVYQISGFTQILPADGKYNVIFNTNRALRSCLEVKSDKILVDLTFNEISRIRSIIFINKE